LAALLAVILTVWEPLALALVVAPRLGSIGFYGWPAVALLIARLLVAGLGVAAGIALWRDAPGARRLAGAALVLGMISSAVSLGTSILPSNLPPGDAAFWIALVVAHNSAWLVYLWRTVPA
jgi:hypothetical protein